MTATPLTIPEVLPLLRAYYAKEGNGLGGSLHIVLEDGNIATCFVRWCKDYAIEKGDEEGSHLADLLLRMSRSRRHRLYRAAYLYPD